MAVLINAFEVPAVADGAFIADWERARGGRGASALHRALRPDVDFRFVEVGHADSADAVAVVGEFASHGALYEVAHEDGAPAGSGGVVLINPFEVPPEEDEAFLAGWNRARHALTGRPGYLGTRLHRSAGPADFRFVNLARWSSPLMFARATARPEFQEAAQEMRFASHPALYTVVRS
jgi:heme-degrading monooxygenase HmoA